MKRILFMFAMALMALPALAQKVVIDDPNAEARSVSGFTGLRVSGGIDVYLSQGGEDAVAVSAREKKFADRIRTEVKDGVLVIYYDDRDWKWDNVNNKKLKAYVTVKTLHSIQASGASDVYIQGTLKADALKVQMSGASDLSGKLHCNSLEVDNSGASDAKLTGWAGKARISMTGASDFKDFDFEADYCEVKATGASDVKLTVNKELVANASGASDIHYRGAGVVKDIRSSGASSVKKRS